MAVAVVSELNAQEFNDEMKKKLRQSLIMPAQKPSQHKLQQPIKIQAQQNQEVLKISPTTKLPTKFDMIQILHPPEEYEIHLDLNVTNVKRSPVTDKTDYSTGKFTPIPDARSISQWTQYTGQGAGASINVGDIDPVRAVQRHKARKRKEKVDRIKKAYGMD